MNDTSTTVTSRHATGTSIWSGPAWWVLVAAASVVLAVNSFFAAMLGLAWLMVAEGIRQDPSDWQWIVQPDGPWDQIGLQTLACSAVYVLVVWAVASAYRARSGGGSGRALRRVTAVLGVAALTMITATHVILFATFNVFKGGLGESVQLNGMVAGAVVPIVVAVLLAVATVRGWKRLLRQ